MSALDGRVVFVAGPSEEAKPLVERLSSAPGVAAAPGVFDVFELGVDHLFDNLEGRDPTLHGLIRFTEREELVDRVRRFCDAVLLAGCPEAATATRLVVRVPPGSGLAAQRRRDVFPDATHLDLPGAPMTRPSLKAIATRLRTELRKAAAGRPRPGDNLAGELMLGLHHRDAEHLRAVTDPALELVVRTPDGDELYDGHAAHEALARLGETLFGRRHVGEWWAGSGGSGDWWTASPGKPLRTMFFSALGGDATRVDVAVAIEPDGDRIRRLVVMTAGSLDGRWYLRGLEGDGARR